MEPLETELKHDLKKIDWKNIFAAIGVFGVIASVIGISALLNSQSLDRSSQAQTIKINNIPTAVPSVAPAKVASNFIYYDAPNTNWNIRPYDPSTTIDFANTDAYSGSYSMQLQFNNSFLPYPYITLHSENQGYSSVQYHQVQFYIKSSSPAIQPIPLLVSMNKYDFNGQGAKPLQQYIDGGSIDTQWRKTVIPFGDFTSLRNARMFYDMFISVQNNPSNWPQFNIDEMKLVCEGDVNGDDVINIQDQQLFQKEMGVCTSNCKADFNNDGVVNISDFNVLKLKFGSACQV